MRTGNVRRRIGSISAFEEINVEKAVKEQREAERKGEGEERRRRTSGPVPAVFLTGVSMRLRSIWHSLPNHWRTTGSEHQWIRAF
jgi:hypothetical protein